MKHRYSFRFFSSYRRTLSTLLGLALLVSSTVASAATASQELRADRNADRKVEPRIAAQASLPTFDSRLPAEATFFLDPKFDNGGFEATARSGAFDANQIDAASAKPASASAVGSLGSLVAAGLLLLAAFNSRKRRTLVRG